MIPLLNSNFRAHSNGKLGISLQDIEKEGKVNGVDTVFYRKKHCISGKADTIGLF
jgi:hypothetical protein